MAEHKYSFEVGQVVVQRRIVTVQAGDLEEAFEKGKRGDVLEAQSSGWERCYNGPAFIPEPFEVATDGGPVELKSHSDQEVTEAATETEATGPMLIDCTKCGALAGQKCTTPSGAVSKIHMKRVMAYQQAVKQAASPIVS